MLKNNHNKTINIFILLSLIVIINIGLVACNKTEVKSKKQIEEPIKCIEEYLYNNVMCINSNHINKNNKIKFKYKNSEKNKNIIIPQIDIIGNLNSTVNDDLQTKLLDDGNVLLYSLGHSFLFESKTNRINYIPPSSKSIPFLKDNPDHYYNANYKKGLEIIGSEKFFLEERGIFDLGNNKYFAFPFLVFNSKNQTFSLMPEDWIKKYKQFANNRKYERNDIKYLNTFSNDTFLYGVKIKAKYPNNNEEMTYINELWLEDPVNLKRSKYGTLITDKSDFATVLLKNGNILIIGGYTYSKEEKDDYKRLSDTIEEYNPATGEIKNVGKLKRPCAPLAIMLNSGKVLIFSGYGQNINEIITNVETFNPLTNSSTLVKEQFNIKLIGLEEEKQYILYTSKIKLLLLEDDRVLLFSYIPRIYDPKTSEFYVISDLLTIRNNAVITSLKNGDVLIVGGYVFYDFVKNTFLNIEDKVLKYTIVERWKFNNSKNE